MAETDPHKIRHKVDDLIITCSDHRFQDAFIEKQRQLGIKAAAKIAYPGSSKEVAEGTLSQPILTLYQLHGFEKAHIFDHTDCGGFGGLEAYGFDENEEAESHFRCIDKAAEVLSTLLPKIAVAGYVFDLRMDEVQRGVDPRIGPSHQDL